MASHPKPYNRVVNWQWPAAIIIAYLLGSIPSGVWIGRIFFGSDVRRYGSGRTGATNVLRTFGKLPAAIVLLMDLAKGVVAVLLARWLITPAMPLSDWSGPVAALCAATGHNWPVFVGFRGGRGVLVSAAGVAVLHFPVFLLVIPLGVLVVWRTRYVSLGSIVSAAASALFFFAFYAWGVLPAAYAAYGVLGAVLVVISHRDNVRRLLAGTESRIGQRVQRTA